MALRTWGIAIFAVGLVVSGTGVAAALTAREIWRDADARCATSADTMCGSGQTLAAAFLLVLGPLGIMLGSLLLLAGAILLAIARRVERAIERGVAAFHAAIAPDRAHAPTPPPPSRPPND